MGKKALDIRGDYSVCFPDLDESFSEFRMTKKQITELNELSQCMPIQEAAERLRRFYRRLRSEARREAFRAYFDPLNYDVPFPVWHDIFLDYVIGG